MAYSKYNDLSGQKFGRLTAIRPVGKDSSRKVIWECECECGNILNVVESKLKSGATQSCGCSRIIHGDAIKKKGQERNQLYRLWDSIKRDSPMLCEKNNWNKYLNFRDWATEHGYDHDTDNWKGVTPMVIKIYADHLAQDR